MVHVHSVLAMKVGPQKPLEESVDLFGNIKDCYSKAYAWGGLGFRVGV